MRRLRVVENEKEWMVRSRARLRRHSLYFMLILFSLPDFLDFQFTRLFYFSIPGTVDSIPEEGVRGDKRHQYHWLCSVTDRQEKSSEVVRVSDKATFNLFWTTVMY